MKTHLLFIFVLLTISLTSSAQDQQGNDKFIVVLDAGHGGKDPGRPTKHGYKESDIALKFVLAVGKVLKANPNIKVIYTRTTDKFLELHERAKIANKADADLFVSIHCNAHNSQAYGSETYVLGPHADQRNFEVAKQENEVIFLEANHEIHYEGFDPNSPESVIGLTLMQEEYINQSIQLARVIESSFKGKLKRKSRGVKQAGFWVLHNTYMPSVLIETGFITNKKEGDYLNSKRGNAEMAKSIANSILNYKKNLDQNVGDNIYDNVALNENEELEQIYNDIVFKVQIAASSRKLAPRPYNFKGLDDISRAQVNALYKYYHGSTSNFTEIKRLQIQAKEKGYSDCFLVAYKNGNEISIEEALKTTSN
ncbi:N-acetylmuramoyl-L-alanine amidase [Flavobacteriales bacterium 34_180_T64]|nr:N-acetylmuramoyl-L-alanine amidase [Flavobacteriales bacterium 34_180_T64]